DLMHRLPFLSGRLRRGFFGYYHEFVADPPMIVPARNGHTFSAYFETGTGHVLRILYGEQHFTLKTRHSICHGRRLTKIVSTLLVRYFQILGMATENAGPIDWSAAPRPEEAEDAFARYADPEDNGLAHQVDQHLRRTAAYHLDCSQPTPARFVTRK